MDFSSSIAEHMSPEMKRARHEMDQKQLIEEVRKRPVLWDATHKSFNSRIPKEIAWAEIAKECGIFPASTVRKKFKNLKDTYRKECRKEFSEWHLKEPLSFLSGQFVSDSRPDESRVDESRVDENEEERKRKYFETRCLKNLDLDVDKLIQLVKLREQLWDKDDRRHCSHRKIDKLWKEVADELGVSTVQARYKWKYLKDTTRRELRKSHSDWLHFQKLQFIFGQFSTISYFPDEDEDQEQVFEDVQEESEDYKQDSDCVGIEEDTLRLSDDDAADEIKPEMVLYNNGDTGASSTTNHDKYKDVVPIMVGDMLDEDVGFFSSLLPHVKKLNSAKKLALRIKIQELVYDAVYEKN